MKTIKWLALAGFVLSLARPAQAQVVDGIAAVVGDKVITFSEVRKQVDPTEKLLRETYREPELSRKIKEARLNGLRALIERQLIIQDFKKQGFFIPENVIEDRMKDVIAREYDGDRTAFIKTLLANGLSVESFKQDIRDQTIVQAMRQKNVSSAVIVSPYRVEQYYQDRIKDFAKPAQVKLNQIFMKRSAYLEKRKNAKGEEESYDQNLAQMSEILYKLNTGSDFAKLARDYSEDSRRNEGGDFGWKAADEMRPEIAKVAFSLKPGQTSSVISTDDGYFIIRVTDRRRPSVLAMTEVRPQVEKILIQEERERLQQEWLDGLRAKSFVKMF
jgi:parvulin-like peptidyl-prolyl isomerase